MAAYSGIIWKVEAGPCPTPSYTTPGTTASPGGLVRSRRSDERMVRLLVMARATTGMDDGGDAKGACEVACDLGARVPELRRPSGEVTHASNRMERARMRVTDDLGKRGFSITQAIAASTMFLDARTAGSVVFGMTAGLEQSNDSALPPRTEGPAWKLWATRGWQERMVRKNAAGTRDEARQTPGGT
jgi:hypothetical protein